MASAMPQLGWGAAGSPIGDELRVAERIVSYSELEYPVEDHPAATRTAAVEAKHELVEIAGQVGGANRTLVRSQQPPLGQRGDPVDAGQEVTGSSLVERAARWLCASWV